MSSIKQFFKSLSEVIIETRRLKAEAYARKYSKL